METKVEFTKSEIISQFTEGGSIEDDSEAAIRYMLERRNIVIGDISEENLAVLRKAISTLRGRRKQKLVDARYRKDLYLKRNAEWLQGRFTVGQSSTILYSRHFTIHLISGTISLGNDASSFPV